MLDNTPGLKEIKVLTASSFVFLLEAVKTFKKIKVAV